MRNISKYVDAIKGNIAFRVGQNAQENFDLLDASEPHDLWFHVSQESSCHVVATIPPEKNYDKKTMKKIAIQGAVICKQNCRYKSDKDVHVIYTTINNVKKGAHLGTVVVDEYKTIVV
jgi:predicted ribosome quality control (RQC) complex YloA/Tae2 family protein